jgi:hypothetical protein
MDSSLYLPDFEKAALRFKAGLPVENGLTVETGVWLESVVLRIHKTAWANKPLTRPQSEAAIFFSIWVSEKGLKATRIFYNIHALKLRQLRAYKVTSRDFAADFRAGFKPFSLHWPNVSVDFGPLTLMEGWIELDAATVAADVHRLANAFLAIAPLIDELLERRLPSR